jgi:DNA-binding response OmpR family regulator
MSGGASHPRRTSGETIAPCETAYVALTEPELRGTVAAAIRELGWEVVEVPSGYHLLDHLAVPLLDRGTHPRLIVVDAFSPGCSGLTIARGTLDLGWRTAVLMVTRSSAQRDLAITSGAPAEVVVEPADVPARARALARTIADSNRADRHEHRAGETARHRDRRRARPIRSQTVRSSVGPPQLGRS